MLHLKIKKYYLLIATVMLGVYASQAQQDAQYTQYMYNTMSVNPAYAGSRGAFSITGLHRSQWLGLEGAPETQSLNLHTPINNSRVGLGFSIINDRIGDGVNQDTYFDVTFSYTVPTSETGKLSFGLKAGGHLLNLDFSKLSAFDQEPPGTYADNIDNKFSPNVGLGVYYHTDKYYLGLSAPNILETEHFNTSSLSTAKERVNLYLITGYVFNLSDRTKFKPALLTKMVSGAPLQVDLSANFLFNDKFMLGAAYRWDAAVSALTGFQISDQLMIGLAYDKETTDLGNTSFNDGSFEVLLRFELFKKVKKTVSPRFF